MYVTTTSNTKRLKSEHTDGEFVEFSDTGTAQVSADIGEALIENYSEITEKS
jgi:hypothetical protein